jgi:hypothetical protein
MKFRIRVSKVNRVWIAQRAQALMMTNFPHGEGMQAFVVVDIGA